MYDPEKLRLMPFRDAAEIWLELEKPFKKPDTFYLLQQHIKRLSTFLGDVAVHKIHIGHVQEFQKARLENKGDIFPKPAKSSIIKHEIIALASVLKRAGHFDADGRFVDEWHKIKPHYRPLKVPPPQTPKVMSDAEEMMVFAVAAQNPAWELAYWVASITCNTGASGTELRNIQLKELYLDARVPGFQIKPETAKNDFRGRFIVLNPTALKQINRCLERANSRGSTGPDDYLFPRRLHRGAWDPKRPASDSWLRRQFAELRDAVGLPWLTPHCFRHQHITLRIEAGDNPALVAVDVGHKDTAMTRYYTHQRRERQQISVNSIDPSVRFGPQPQRIKVVNTAVQK